MNDRVEQPKKRSVLRLKAGKFYYTAKRKLLWFKMRKSFARKKDENKLPYVYFSHRTPLLRKLKDVDMWMQYNKITNLNLAVKCINGIVLRPGEVFSYWRLIGKPSAQKGYKEGMTIYNGKVGSGIGGGLCQLSNLIFWTAVHTPLTIIERHRHGFDVFPDANRTQPFGSGATCYYPYGDLMIRNDTPDTYQLTVRVGTKNLEGEWRVSAPPVYSYEIVEKNHEMRAEYWGGYSRRNELYQQKFDLDGNLLDEQLLVTNAAIMMYSPFLEENKG